jgi:NAD-dependent deacetylase
MSDVLPGALVDRLQKLASTSQDSNRPEVVVLTGAGISAESGIPTFRGKEGYWVVGSVEYHPQEMATLKMFRRDPEAVWAWYLYRRTVCRSARPNAGHEAIVRLESALQERFLLITQNVDGLHLRAGNSLARTFQIHGNIDFARCLDHDRAPFALPEDLAPKTKGDPLTAEERALLSGERSGDDPCAGWWRPHVLWFDECYDDVNFHFTSSLKAASEATVLLVVGTSGATNLPMQVGMTALSRGATIVDINPDDNPFAQLAAQSEGGFHLQGPAGRFLPAIAEIFDDHRGSD